MKAESQITEDDLTAEERELIGIWRRYVGVPYIAALQDEQKMKFKVFLDSLREFEASSMSH
jgi:hypothetical protein